MADDGQQQQQPVADDGQQQQQPVANNGQQQQQPDQRPTTSDGQQQQLLKSNYLIFVGKDNNAKQDLFIKVLFLVAFWKYGLSMFSQSVNDSISLPFQSIISFCMQTYSILFVYCILFLCEYALLEMLLT